MDPKTQQPIQNPVPQQPTQPPIQQPVRQPVAPMPAQPISGGSKEAPVPLGAAQEWVSPSTPEVVMPKEVSEAGVEATPVIQPIPQQVQQLGVQHAKEATPVESVVAEPLGLKTSRSVLDQLKAAHKSVKESFSWLIRLILKEQEKKENHTTSGYN